MAKTKFKMPPCAINPVTEKPYTRHKWTISKDRLVRKPNDPIYYYHVVCERPTCKLNSRNPVRF